jgi:hypothetical protein
MRAKASNVTAKKKPSRRQASRRTSRPRIERLPLSYERQSPSRAQKATDRLGENRWEKGLFLQCQALALGVCYHRNVNRHRERPTMTEAWSMPGSDRGRCHERVCPAVRRYEPKPSTKGYHAHLGKRSGSAVWSITDLEGAEFVIGLAAGG